MFLLENLWSELPPQEELRERDPSTHSEDPFQLFVLINQISTRK